LPYVHVDVFSACPYSGNGLPVFLDGAELDARQMLRITQELRQFEAIFLTPGDETERVRARIFDLHEELPFAGHPIIGAACALHAAEGGPGPRTFRFELQEKCVTVTSSRTADGYYGLLDQGAARFLGEVEDRASFAALFSLLASDLDPLLPLAVASTGLRYLIVPVTTAALGKARITRDLGDALRRVGAQFAVLFDERQREMRHWNNDGVLEDVATGSAAGAVGAYRLRYARARSGEAFVLQQGRFTGRASELRVEPVGTPHAVSSVRVGGHVSIVGSGTLSILPS
jgi:PhzF family phenazine biosynthesis protein